MGRKTRKRVMHRFQQYVMPRLINLAGAPLVQVKFSCLILLNRNGGETKRREVRERS